MVIQMDDFGSNIAGRILAQAEREGWLDKVALVEGKRSLCYRQLTDQVGRSASVLVSLGMKKGDRVAVYSPDCLEAAVAILATLWAGGIVVPVSELCAGNDLRDLLANSQTALVLSHQSLRGNVDEIRSEVPGLASIVSLGVTKLDKASPGLTTLMQDHSAASVVSMAADEPAVLLYSAGASHESNANGMRGVLHSHTTPIHAYESFAQGFLSITAQDRVFSTVRFSTAYGLGTGFLFPLLAGAQCRLLPEQAHSKVVFAALAEYKPTIFAATPSLYGQLARDAATAGQTKILADVRWSIAGAETMPLQIVAMVRAVLGSNVTVGYGLTEAFQFVIAGPAAGKRPGNCGHVLEGVEVRIVDDQGAEVGEDEIGTLELRSKTIVTKYWGNDTDLENGGWFTTLDRFMVDSDKNYYHCGRADHLFKVGGKWVAPAEVERALLANEAVWECAVIGAEDEDGLTKPFAFIVANIGQTPGAELEATLREYVKKELAPYKYPRWIEFVDALPKASNGIVLRYKLRDRLTQSRSRRRAETRGE